MNLRLLKFILFIPFFIACQAGSEIIPPDSGDNGTASDFSCTLSSQTLAFDQAYDYQPASLTASVGDERVIVDLSGAPWMEVEGNVTTISPNSAVTLNFVPKEPNYRHEDRSGVIVFKGKYTGESVEVPVSQAASYQDADESLLNGWRLDSDMAPSENWLGGKTLTANKGDLKGLLTLEHSVNSDVRVISDENRGTFTGMRPGDAVLMRAPVRSLAAGTDVSAMINIGHKTTGTESRWAAEYWDEDKWNTIREFTTCNDDGEFNYATFVGDFTLNSQIENDYVKLRFRLVEGEENAVHFIAASPWTGAAMEVNSAYPPVTDYKKVLILGNSFTYYWGSPFVLKQIARSQGHRLDVRVHTEPGATLAEHLDMYSLSDEAVDEGGYHYAILQEQSTAHAQFMDGKTEVLSDANKLSNAIRRESLTYKLILENTWSYAEDNYKGYGSHEVFDAKLQEGCRAIAKSLRAEVSPVGLAFAYARTDQPDINCFYKDDHHPSRKGAYLKSCVNYLKIYGGEFTGTPYEGEVGDAAQAEALRTIAAQAVAYVPVEKPKEPVTLTIDFSTSWPFSPDLAAGSSVKIKTKDAYTFTQDGVEYPIEIYSPTDGYYYIGDALRLNSKNGSGYIKVPAIEGKALVELTGTITNSTGSKTLYVSSDASDAGDIGKLTISSAEPKTNSVQLTGALPGYSYYLFTNSTNTQIAKLILTYE